MTLSRFLALQECIAKDQDAVRHTICRRRHNSMWKKIEKWWSDHAGDPEDPNGLGINLLQTVFWAIILGVLLLGLSLFG